MTEPMPVPTEPNDKKKTTPQSIPLYVMNWKISEQIPPQATRHELQALRTQLNQQLHGADVKQFAVAMSAFWEFVRVFQVGKEPADVEAATKMFRKALEDVPIDLLNQAIQRLIATWKWGSKFPLPADIKSQINEELSTRLYQRRRVQSMLDEMERRNRGQQT